MIALFVGGWMTAAAADDPLTQVAFLTGCWRTEGAVSEECWLAPRGGLMLGVHRDVRPGKEAFYEHLRIAVVDGSVVYVASPAGQATTSFTLVEATPRRAVFANPAHDFPQRITYSRMGDQLTAEISGTIKGEARSSAWTFQTAAFPLSEPASQ